MSVQEHEDNTIYKVVVNHEEQYSIWPDTCATRCGWNDASKSGSKAECLEFVKEVWTDMRPLSLRKRMEEDREIFGEQFRVAGSLHNISITTACPSVTRHLASDLVEFSRELIGLVTRAIHAVRRRVGLCPV